MLPERGRSGGVQGGPVLRNRDQEEAHVEFRLFPPRSNRFRVAVRLYFTLGMKRQQEFSAISSI